MIHGDVGGALGVCIDPIARLEFLSASVAGLILVARLVDLFLV